MQNDQGCYGIPRKQNSSRSEMHLVGGNGHGSPSTNIRRFVSVKKRTGNSFQYNPSATAGDSITILEDGYYSIAYTDFNGTASETHGVSINTTGGATAIQSLTEAEVLTYVNTGASLSAPAVVPPIFLPAGTIVRAHTDGTSNASSNYCRFIITKVGL